MGQWNLYLQFELRLDFAIVSLYLLLVVDVPLDVVKAPVVPVPDVLHDHFVLELSPNEG